MNIANIDAYLVHKRHKKYTNRKFIIISYSKKRTYLIFKTHQKGPICA